MSKKWIVALVLSVLLIGVVATTALAQTATPTTPAAPAEKGAPFMKGWGFMGRGWGDFDAIAKSLNLTPTQLFERLHSGKTLEEIATAQGVDLQKLQDAAKAAQLEAQKKAIEEAVTAGKLTREQADWMLKGLENGWGFGGRGGFGHGRGHGRGGFGPDLTTPQGKGTSAPASPFGSQKG